MSKTATKTAPKTAVKQPEEAETAAAKPEPRDLTVHDRIERSPGITIAEIATSAGWGRSTVTKAVRRLEDQGLVTRTKGGHDGTKRLPDTFALTGTEQTSGTPAKKTAAAKPSEPGTAQKKERLGKGELRKLVARLLTDHPKVEFGPSQIAKELRHSAGAISNALDKMVRDELVEQTNDEGDPKRFRWKKTSTGGRK